MAIDDDYAANLLGALGIAVSDRINAATTGATKLDASATAALLVVNERPGRPIEHLRVVLELTHSGAVRLTDRLEHAGLLRRGAGRDGRSRGLEPTAKGRRLSEAALLSRRSALRELLHGLTASQRAQLIEVVTAVLADTPQTRADAWRVCRLCDHATCRDEACPVGTSDHLDSMA